MRKRYALVLAMPALLIVALVSARLALAHPIEVEPYVTVRGGCLIYRDTHYTVCGHKKRFTALAEPRLIGMDLSRFSREFSGWDVGTFSAQRVLLDRNIAQYCPDHYLLKESDGRLIVYQNATGDGEWFAIRTLTLLPFSLPDSLRTEVRRGRVFDSLADIETLLGSAAQGDAR